MNSYKLRLILKVVTINFVLIIFVLFLSEIIFGNWLKNNNYGNLIIPRYVKNLIDNPPYESNSRGIYSRDKNGFRANNYELLDISILIIGGSTTEERDVDDKLIWTKVLDNNLLKSKPMYVLNAGIGGQTSFGHIRIFNLWLSRFDDLKPKFILFYIGMNDALYMLESIKNQKIVLNGRVINKTDRDNLIHNNFIEGTVQYIKNNSAIHLLYWIIKGNYIARKFKINYTIKKTNFLPKYVKDITKDMNLKDNNFTNYLDHYEYNLKTLVKNSIKFDAIPVFITQTTANDHWLKKYVSIINKRTIKFCINNNISYIDLANLISFDDNTDFYDGIHTTPKGSKKIGEFIYNNFNY